MMELAMIQEFLPASGKARSIVTADQPGQGILPLDGQALQAFENSIIEKRFRHVREPLQRHWE